MGQTNSTPSENLNTQYREYRLIRTLSDPTCGQIYEMKHQSTGNVIFMKEHINLEQMAYQSIINECKSRLNLEHPGLLKLFGFSAENSCHLLGNNSNTHKVQIFFESFVMNLQQEIMRKKKTSLFSGMTHQESTTTNLMNYFTEQELLQIILRLIETFSFLQLNKITHGDIRTNSIFVTASGGIKVIDRKLAYDRRSSLQIALQGDKDVLLSPISLLEIRKKKQINQNDFKADVFSLGMAFIEIATLEKSSQFYNWERCEIILSTLESRLIEIKKRYSDKIYLIIREMIRFNEEERPDFLLLKQQILEEGKTYQISSIKTTDSVIFF